MSSSIISRIGRGKYDTPTSPCDKREHYNILLSGRCSVNIGEASLDLPGQAGASEGRHYQQGVLHPLHPANISRGTHRAFQDTTPTAVTHVSSPGSHHKTWALLSAARYPPGRTAPDNLVRTIARVLRPVRMRRTFAAALFRVLAIDLSLRLCLGGVESRA